MTVTLTYYKNKTKFLYFPTNSTKAEFTQSELIDAVHLLKKITMFAVFTVRDCFYFSQWNFMSRVRVSQSVSTCHSQIWEFFKHIS